MKEELATEPLLDDDNQPATKGFVRSEIDKLAQATQKGFEEVHSEMTEMRSELRGEMTEMRSELRGEMTEMRSELRGEMKAMKEEIINEFKVVAENIHQDVAGANADEISSIRDKQRSHEKRIQALERAR